jgi:hypothetical protein
MSTAARPPKSMPISTSYASNRRNPSWRVQARSAVAKITIGRQRLADELGFERGHRPSPEGDKAVTIPLAPPAARRDLLAAV